MIRGRGRGRGGGIAPIIPTNYQIIANQTAVTNVLRAGNTSARTDVQNQNRQFHICGKGAVTSLKIGMTGYRVPSTGAAAVAIGNDYTLEAAFEKVSPASSTRFLFSGANSGTVANGANLVLSDALTVNIAAGEQFAIRKNITIASETMNFPDITSYLLPTDNRYTSPAAASQLLNTGAMTTPTGGTPAGAAIAACLLGIPSVATPSVVIVGDSIANGSTDNARGYIIRGLDSVNGYNVPWSRSTVNSWSYNAASTSTQIQAIWPYCTHILFELGVNDIQNGRTLLQIQTDMTTLWTAAKAVTGPYGKPLKVYQTIITPKTTSTDSFATTANQTLATGFTTGGIRDQLNAWIKAQVGLGLLDGYVDPTIYCEDQSNFGKWVVNGTANYATADGIHPTSTFHQAMAAAVNSWAATLTV